MTENSVRALALQQIEDARKTLDRLNKMDKVIEPLATHTFITMQHARKCWKLEVRNIEIDEGIYNWLTGVGGAPVTELWGVKFGVLDGSHFNCYVLTLEDGSQITHGFTMGMMVPKTEETSANA
ncbi:MAG: hypothetical protein KY445_06300 [Armatimonadetes bacterium]|nr:hypothetical protein [Armatimonadota bacterium]